jgi:signal transduction histidine kinase
VERFAFFGGRLALPLRVGALALIDLDISTNHPRPGLHGTGVVVLAAMIIATAAQVGLVLGVRGPATRPLCATGAVAAGLATGVDPASAAVGLLALAALDAGVNLPTVEGATVAGAAAVTTALAVLISDQHPGYLALALVAVLLWSIGVSRRQSGMRTAEAELRLAERERAAGEQERAARLAERASIAREIHDVLAHSLGALVLQLDALDAVVHAEGADPARVDLILSRARRLAQEGLHEARQAVGTLRADTPPLPEWIQSMLDTAGIGLLTVSGTPRRTASETAVTVYRTAQESLTNVVKHAPGASVRVDLTFTPDAVELTVTDDGRVSAGPADDLASTGGGYGLGGLRERAGLIGGTLEAGPHQGGWRVALHVPDAPPGTAAPAVTASGGVPAADRMQA